MFLSGVDYPNEIIDAIQNDNLVVFAGAGVSVDYPTCLPDFESLAKAIARGTGKLLPEKGNCEVFLGQLKANGIDVNTQAAEILSSTCLEPNDMHRAIMNLFLNTDKPRIVTTNYDQMFEEILRSKESVVTVYNAPALPLGNNVEGIVHVHGNTCDPQYMVVTDEDFGVAYLLEGYATRFLSKLFESYTILFIGYSYNDTIMRYLSRAMVRSVGKSRYILTDNEANDWHALGIKPIFFPKGDFKTMKDSLEKLGQRSKRDLIDWNNQLLELSEYPPSEFSMETEVDYCLSSIERTRVLSECIDGAQWFEYLNRKGLFDKLFSLESELSEYDLIWGKWICDRIIGVHDALFKKTLFKKGNTLNKSFASMIIRKIEDNEVLNNEQICEYYTIVKSYVHNSWDVFRLIEVCAKRELKCFLFELFAKYFEVSFVLEEQFLSNNQYAFKHRFLGEKYHIEHSLKNCEEILADTYPQELIELTKSVVHKLYNYYLALGLDCDGSEPWNLAWLVVEDREDYSKDIHLVVLSKLFCESCKRLEQSQSIYVMEIVKQCLYGESVLLKKIALKALRELSVISADEKFDAFAGLSSIYPWGCKEQVFLLIESIFNELSEERQNLLIDWIENEDVFEDSEREESNAYSRYNWCIWINRFAPDNNRINELRNQILLVYDFKPREHPELSIEFSSEAWIADESPINQNEMTNIDIDTVVEYLINYDNKAFEGPSRWGLLNTFTNCCRENFDWMVSVAKSLLSNDVSIPDVWECVARGLSESHADAEKKMQLLNLLVSRADVVKNIKALSRVLFEVVRNDISKRNIKAFEKELISISDALWKRRSDELSQFERKIDAAYNTVVGNIILSYIHMVFYQDANSIPDEYKVLFENNLNLDGAERELSIFIIGGHFNSLSILDREWCLSSLQDILEGQNEKEFSAIWEGITWFSNRVVKELADVLLPLYYNALEHFSWLSEETRNNFIELYLVLLIHVVDEPLEQYIPKFFEVSNEEDIIHFSETIERILKSEDDDFKISWWNRWLKEYVIARKQSKPTRITDSEYKVIMNWLLELECVFEDAVAIVLDNSLPKIIGFLFLRRLCESEIPAKYPNITATLVTRLLNNGTVFEYCRDEIEELFNLLEDISESERRSFKDAMLKRGFALGNSKK